MHSPQEVESYFVQAARGHFHLPSNLLTLSFNRLIWMAGVETLCRGLLLEERIEGQMVPKLSKRAGDLFMGVDNQVESSNAFRAT